MLLNFAKALGKARKALASRHLFDNWLSLMIRYALHRLGFDVKLTAKIRGCTFEISPETFERLVRARAGDIVLTKSSSVSSDASRSGYALQPACLKRYSARSSSV
jgi:hypothetical protein